MTHAHRYAKAVRLEHTRSALTYLHCIRTHINIRARTHVHTLIKTHRKQSTLSNTPTHTTYTPHTHTHTHTHTTHTHTNTHTHTHARTRTRTRTHIYTHTHTHIHTHTHLEVSHWQAICRNDTKYLGFWRAITQVGQGFLCEGPLKMVDVLFENECARRLDGHRGTPPWMRNMLCSCLCGLHGILRTVARIISEACKLFMCPTTALLLSLMEEANSPESGMPFLSCIVCSSRLSSLSIVASRGFGYI